MAPRRLPAWLPWAVCAVSVVMIAISGWFRLSEPGTAEAWGWPEQVLVALATTGIPVVGALIASRQPANPYGWLWCGIGLGFGGSGVTHPAAEALGAPSWVAQYLDGLNFALFVPLLVLAILLFPDGAVPGPSWRWLLRAVIALGLLRALAETIFLGAPPGDGVLWAAQAWVVVMFALGLAAVGALVVRYRGGGPVERKQLTWFLYAALLAAAVLTVTALDLIPWRPVAVVVQTGSLALFPAAVAVAVLRYRLYEIDRIVSRTVTYGLLTASIAVVYVVVVGGLTALGVPEGRSDVAVATVTLAVAAVVGRVRRRLQTAVDRRFDRARYDAARAVDAFAARLRNQVDLDEITGGLRDTVTATVAPGRVAVWLRPERRS